MLRALPCGLLLTAWILLPVGTAKAQYGERGEALAAPRPDQPVPPPPPAEAPPPPEGYAGGAPDASPSPSAADSDTAAPSPGSDGHLAVPDAIATRLRALDSNLSMLARRGSSGVVEGVLSVLAGGLSITMGAVLNDGHADGRRFARYLYLWGSAQVTRGILSFVLPIRADDVAIHFQHMPMGTRQEIRDRLLFGEETLERLARRARTSRLLDASINTAVGLLAVPLYLAPADFEIRSGNDYFVIVASGVSLITGVIGFILKSEAERRWSAYTKLRQRLEAQGTEAADEEAPPDPDQARGFRWNVGGAPMRGGFVGTFGATF